jgi:hypothetical protein
MLKKGEVQTHSKFGQDENGVDSSLCSDQWNAIFSSLKKFSSDFMFERVQPVLEKREGSGS